MTGRMVGKREAKRRFQMMWVFEKEREREREGGEDIETEWNDVKLIYVWWKEHQLG